MKFIYNGHSKKSGVYKIINTQNERVYIGSAKEFKERGKAHLSSLRKNKHSNKFLQNDFNKCGEDVFEFHVLEVVEGEKEQRFLKEDQYLKQFHDDQDKCYNFKRKTSGVRLAWSHTPEETRKKLSKASKKKWQDPEYREKITQATAETWRNPEFRQKRIEGLRKAGATEEHKQKKSEAGKAAWAKDDGARREQVSEQSKEMWADPEYRARKLNQATGRRNTEEQKKRMSEAALNRASDTEETRRIKSAAAKKRFQDPKQRELLAEIGRNKKPLSEEARKKISEAHKGRPCKEETKRKISLANKGRMHSLETKKKCGVKNAKVFNLVLVSPDGEEFLLEKNLAAFCRKHDLNKSGMWRMISGRTRDYLGWKLEKFQ